MTRSLMPFEMQRCSETPNWLRQFHANKAKFFEAERQKVFLNAWDAFLWTYYFKLLIWISAEEMREIKEKLNVYMFMPGMHH